MKKITKIFASLLLLAMFILPAVNVFAVPTNSKAPAKTSSSAPGGIAGIKGQLKTFGDRSYGSSAVTDPRMVVGSIINAGLGLLGTLLVIYFVYGGIMWMTSNGESSKVDKAKGILRQAVIGIIIVLSAYAISSFIVTALVESTTSGTVKKT